MVCIHWFNPFVYLLEKEVNRACELSCDEAVVFMLDAVKGASMEIPWFPF